MSSPTPPAVQLYFEMQARCLLIYIYSFNKSFSVHSQSHFMQAQDHVAGNSATIFPHVCALCTFPYISSSDDETISKLEQFLERVIN